MRFNHAFDRPRHAADASARLDSVLSLGPRTASMSSISVTRKFQQLSWRQLQDLLEPGADLHQSILVTTLAGCSCPEADSVESLPDVDNDPHDLVVTFILKGLTNGRELSM